MLRRPDDRRPATTVLRWSMGRNRNNVSVITSSETVGAHWSDLERSHLYCLKAALWSFTVNWTKVMFTLCPALFLAVFFSASAGILICFMAHQSPAAADNWNSIRPLAALFNALSFFPWPWLGHEHDWFIYYSKHVPVLRSNGNDSCVLKVHMLYLNDSAQSQETKKMWKRKVNNKV